MTSNYFIVKCMNILTGQKRHLTELKFGWPVILTGAHSIVIFSPGGISTVKGKGHWKCPAQIRLLFTLRYNYVTIKSC